MSGEPNKEHIPPTISINSTIPAFRLDELFSRNHVGQYVSYKGGAPLKIEATQKDDILEVTGPARYSMVLVDEKGTHFLLKFTRQQPPHQDTFSVRKYRGGKKILGR